MRAMMIAIGIAALLWSGYWLIGSRQATQTTRAWFAEREADGWVAGFTGIVTRGFPNRFDTTITAPELAAPGGAMRWSAPFVQFFRLSYKPEHVIVIFPESQAVTVAGHKVAVSSSGLKASVVFERGETPDLARANLAAEAVALESGSLGTAAMGRVLAAIRKSGTGVGHDLAIELLDVVVSDSNGAHKVSLQSVALDAVAVLDEPLGLGAVEAGRIDVTRLSLRRFQIVSGTFELSATGSLTMDTSGLPSGTLDLQVRDWREGLRLAADSGLISLDATTAIEAELASRSGDQRTGPPLDLQLEIRRGLVYLGSTRLD